MRTSDQTDKIDAAIQRVQSRIGLAERNKGVEVEGKTTKFATKYVTIDALWEACRALLAEERIAIWQGGGFEPNGGGERLYTRLALDGQWILSSFPVKAREGAQNFGGGIAFARRWGLAGAVGIFPKDDPDEKHGYEVSRAEGKVARRAPAPAGIADATAAIREAADVTSFEAHVARARGAFPTGESAKAVEDAVSAWLLAAFETVTAPEHEQALVALRVACNRVKPKSPEVRAAIASAEKRVKGGPS